MSIKLKFEKGSVVVAATLKDEAFAELLALVSKHESDELERRSGITTDDDHSGEGEDASGDDPKEWLAKHSPSEVLNMIGWKTYPEKIMLLGAFHEAANKENDSWRSADIEDRFNQARDARPSNFPRDISKAIAAGIVVAVTPRTYRVSRTGWNKIVAAIPK